MAINNSKLKNIVVGITGAAVGVLFLFWANQISDEEKYHTWKSIVDHIGVIALVAFTLHVISESFLKKEFLENIRGEINDSIENSLPNSVKKIKSAGIVDVFHEFPHESFSKRLSTIADTEIIFLTMWIPDMASFSRVLIKAVNERNCKLRLLIFDPTSENTIQHRANSISSLGIGPDSIKMSITENCRNLRAAFAQVRPEKQKNFECRFYNEWVSLCIYGSGEELLIGHYLMDQLATQNHFLKIYGHDKELYMQFHAHFEKYGNVRWRNLITMCFPEMMWTKPWERW